VADFKLFSCFFNFHALLAGLNKRGWLREFLIGADARGRMSGCAEGLPVLSLSCFISAPAGPADVREKCRKI